jgi:hypothetical protein
MAMSAVAGMVLEAWNDLDRATAGLSAEDASRRIGTASPISWSIAHCANQIDSYVNVLFQGREPHPFLGQEGFRFGAAGDPAAWEQVQAAVAEVREIARPYLESLSEADLQLHVPYRGSLTALRETGMSVRYALIRVALHHYFHIGEIAAARTSLGHQVGDYPGLLEQCL